jgi:hypothetical protein
VSEHSRITYGEFDWPDENVRQSYLRNVFLMAVGEYAPEVWGHLYDKVLPVYNQLRSQHPNLDFQNINYSVTSSMSQDLTQPIFLQFGSLALLVRFLEAWQGQHGLIETDAKDRWVLKVALRQLEIWNRLPLAPDEKPSGPLPIAAFGGKLVRTPEPPEGWPEYDPIVTTPSEYLSFVHYKAQKAIDEHPILKLGERSHAASFVETITSAYVDEVERCYEREGYPRSEAGKRRRLAQHLNWTVRTQVMGGSQTELAKEGQRDGQSVTPQAISKAVNQLLRDTGLVARSRYVS